MAYIDPKDYDSFAAWSNAKKKKKEEEEKDLNPRNYQSFTEWSNAKHGKSEEDIAPVKEDSTERTWFKKSEGDTKQTFLGSVTDLGENLFAGFIGIGEKIADAAVTLGAARSRQTMNEAAQMEMMFNTLTGKKTDGVWERYQGYQKESEKGAAEFVSKDLYDEKAVAKALISDNARKVGIDTERHSVFGEKSDELAMSAGQLGGQILVSAVPGVGQAAGLTMLGATTFGSEAESAFRNGASLDEAVLSSAISMGAEMLSEKLGGVKFGGKSLTDAAFGKLSSAVTNKFVRALISAGKIAADSSAESLEEVVSGYVSAWGQTLTYMDDKEIEELFTREDLLDSAIGGFVLGGTFSGVGTMFSGRDAASGLNKHEQAVVDKVANDAIAEKEKGGKALTSREKAKIRESVVERMEKGQIDIDTIESTLGGKAYKAYTDHVNGTEALKTELEELRSMKSGDMNDVQTSRMAELKEMNLDDTTKRDELRKKLADTLKPMLKGSKLQASYAEAINSKRAFEADLSKYKGKQREAVERAVKSGVLNNSYRSHELVDVLSKLEADKGIVFDYTNNAKLKESGFAVEGKTVNGYVNNGSVTLNVQSAKAWQSVVGHEITHILKDGVDEAVYNDLQKALYEYAESKGELESRRSSLTELYNGLNADIESELTADLVGDYLFTDKAFIDKLTGNRTLFQKIYDEVKYLWNVATGKEKADIEKVKDEFDKAWKQLNTKPSKVMDGSALDSNIPNVIEQDTEVFAEDSSGVGLEEDVQDIPWEDLPWEGMPTNENTEGEASDADIPWEDLPWEDMSTNENTKSESGAEDVKVMDGGAAVKYSLSTWTPETQEKVRNNLTKAGFEADRVDKWISDLNGVAAVIASDKDRLDYEAADNQVMLKNNQEYVKTLDSSTLCDKRLPYQGTFNEIQHRLPDTVLTSDDLIELLNLMKEHGYKAPCSVCYVESRRRHLGKFAQEWLDSYEGAYKPRLDELTTTDGLENLRHSQPETYKAFTDAMNAKGSANPKVVQLRTEYNNDIMKLTPKQIEKILAIGGLRIQSLSDFETPHLLDMMQAVMDMAAKELTSQAYTKVPNFAWVFGDTGIKINLSLIAEGSGLDADGNLIFSSTEGMDINEAMAVRDAYSENVGTIIVGANDAHILACMADPRIDYIIPFHRSGWGKNEMEMMGLGSYDDYSYGQNEHDIETGKKVANLYPPDYWDYSVSGKENAERYLKLCAQTGREPKFSNFLVDNGDGSYSLQPDGSTDGYWKTLIDFKMYDNEGNGVKQQKVQPNFNMDEAYRVLNEYEGGANSLPVANDVVEEFVAKHSDNIAPVQNSLSNEGEQFAPVGNYSTPLKDLALEGDVAPVAENVAPTAEAATEAPFPNEIAPMTEEEANALQDEKAQADAAAEGLPKSRKQLHSNILNDIKATFSSGGFDFDDVLAKAKNLSTFSTVDNTPQRVMEKALGYKEGQVLADLTVNKVAQNETAGIKWLNSFTDRKNGLLAQMSKQYRIKPGSKESAAAQMYAEGFYVNDNNDIIAYGDAELAKDFPDAGVRNRIKGLAHDPRIRQIYDDTLNAINDSRARNAYPEIQRLENYFLHFRAMDDTFSKLGLPFNPNDIRAKDLPTDLNGVTADLKPGQPYFASAMHRTGKRTSFDLLGGLERYLTSAKNQIYHIDDIQTLRALRNYIADTYGQANGLEGIDVLSEEEAQERIEQVYSSHLSTFAKFLNEEANVLAGKTALIDRGLEGVIGRRAMTFLDTVNKQVGSNMVGFNISSSLTNFLPVAQTFAKTNKFDFTKAFAQTVSNKISSVFGKNDGFAENSPVIIRRKGADRFYRTPWQKAGDAGYFLMSAVDDISTELIARTKFNELTRKGMDEQTAHFETDKWVSRLMGDRSIGQQPQLFNSKTLGVITKFQLEVRNQLDSQFYDTIQEAKVSNEEIQNALARNAKTAAKVASTFVQLAVVQHLYGKAFESIAGYNPAFDIISTLATMFGFDDEEDSEDTVLDNIEQGFFELLEDLPYTSTLTGGRIPMASALPVTELIKGVDSYGNEKSRWETIKEAAPYYILPGGYGQVKKTKAGLNMFSDEHPVSGSYTNAGKLRFPVEDTPLNRVQAALFGQYASGNAREYFDNGYAPLSEKQIQEYINVEMPIADYWKYRDGLKGLETNEAKAEYINSLDIEDWQKNLLMNNILDRKEDVDMTNYDDFSDFEEFDFYQKYPEKYDFLKENGISFDDYNSADDDTRDFYNDAYNSAKDSEGKRGIAKVVADSYVDYYQYYKDINKINGDDFDGDGKTDSGTKKKNVYNYIFNELDLDYGSKCVLFKSKYAKVDDYGISNEDIVNYIYNRQDLTENEKTAILTELKYTVEGGYVYW